MSGLIGANNQFGQQFGHPDATMQGICETLMFWSVEKSWLIKSSVTSIYDIGCAVGCLLSFVVGHKVGRKKMIIAGGTIMVIGTIILASSYTRAQFLVGRVVTGFGNGINSSTVPTYQSGKWKDTHVPNKKDHRNSYKFQRWPDPSAVVDFYPPKEPLQSWDYVSHTGSTTASASSTPPFNGVSQSASRHSSPSVSFCK